MSGIKICDKFNYIYDRQRPSTFANGQMLLCYFSKILPKIPELFLRISVIYG